MDVSPLWPHRAPVRAPQQTPSALGRCGAWIRFNPFTINSDWRPIVKARREVLCGTHEIIARAIHEGYVGYREKLDRTPQIDPDMVPWEKLTEEFRESCRRQADHIGLKLEAVGCGLALLTDWDAELFEFTLEEVERMARMEHERWMAERRREGWTTGPRDSKNRTNPYLVPWEELSEEIKELNRDMVRGFPAFLARVGLQAYRLK